MSIINRLIPPATAAGAAAGVPDTLTWRDVFLGGRSGTGKTVTPETALGIPALWGGMRILTDTIGSMPFKTYQRTTGAGRQEAFSQPIYKLLRYRPNDEMVGTQLWRQVMFHLNSYGNSYLSKIFTGSQLTALWPIQPDRVRVERRGGQKLFYVADTFWRWNGPYTQNEILHIQGISFDGIVGISPIAAAREAIGLGLALDEFTNSFFANGGIPRVVLKTKGKLESPNAAKRITDDWNRRHSVRSGRANGTAVLEEGLDVQVLSFPMKDLQFVEQMQWTAADIARILRLPASKLNVSTGDSMTYKTAETEQLDLLACIQGWTTLIEETVSADPDIFPNPPNRPSLYGEFYPDALLRIDAKTRSEYLQRATAGKPWMRGNDARISEGLPSDPTIDDVVGTGPPSIPSAGV